MKQYKTSAFCMAHEPMDIVVFMIDDDGSKYFTRFSDPQTARNFIDGLEAVGFKKVRKFQYDPNRPCVKAQEI